MRPFPLDVTSISPADNLSHHIFTHKLFQPFSDNCPKILFSALSSRRKFHFTIRLLFSSHIHTFTDTKLAKKLSSCQESWSEIASLSFSSHIHCINQPRHQSHHIFTKVITALNSIILSGVRNVTDMADISV